MPHARQTKETSEPAESARPRTTAGPKAGGELATTAFAQLLKIEADARRATSTRELDAQCVNECRLLLRARQAVVFEPLQSMARVVALSGTAAVDRSVPMVQWLEEMLARVRKEAGLGKLVDFELPGYAAADDPLTREYPFRHVLFLPLWSPDGIARAGLLLLRETPWLDADRKIALRLAETFGHARTLLRLMGRSRTRAWPTRKQLLMSALAVASLGAVPVPISVLAPLEVVPRNADVVAMPIEGIVHKVLVKANETVAAGTPLVRLVDTVYRGREEVAAKEVAVAAARVEQATSLAFNDPRGRQELGVARAEHALKIAEHNYAKAILGQTVIKAERPGIAVFSDPREIEGRPLGVGERLMLVAREGETEIKIALPIADSIVLRPGLRVKAFLDADPLHSVEAAVSTVDFQARIDETQTAVYPVTARPVAERTVLALGSRGTAQILGEQVPIFVYLFRRPIAAVRQRLGF